LGIDREQLFRHHLDLVRHVVVVDLVVTLFLQNLSLHRGLSRQMRLVPRFLILLGLGECSISHSCGLGLLAFKSTDERISNFGGDAHLLGQVSLEVFLVLMLLLPHRLGGRKRSGKGFLSLSSLRVPVVGVTFSFGGCDSSGTSLCVVMLLVLDKVELSLELALLGDCLFEKSLDFAHLVVFVVGRVGGSPVRLEVQLAGGPALVLNHEPLVPRGLAAEGGELGLAVSNLFVATFVLVEQGKLKVVTKILDVDFELGVLPLRLLAAVLVSLGLPLKVTTLNLHVGIHFADCLGIAGQVRFEDFNCQGAKGHY
jgi:hypothetical protein